MDYDLTQLVGWARRLSRDEVVEGREVFVSDGVGEIELSATGSITLNEITSDGDDVSTDDVELISKTVVFSDAADVPEGARVVIRYNNSSYSDTQVSERVTDAAREVGSDLEIEWEIDTEGFLIIDVPDAEVVTFRNQDKLNPLVEKLIALKAGINLYTDKANKASDEALLVRDGDTTLDTSKAAAAGSKTLERMNHDYREALRAALTRRLQGLSGEGSISE